MTRKKDTIVTTESVDTMFEEFRIARKKHPIYYFFHDLYWRVYHYITGIPLKIRTFIQRGKRGWADSDSWGFSYYLARVIEEGLINIQKYGHSVFHESKDLQIIIDTFIKAQEILEDKVFYLSSTDFTQEGYNKLKKLARELSKRNNEKYRVMTKREILKYEKGFDLFKEHFFSFWD